MTPATVLLVGTDELASIPDYLRLGAVVVVAPDRETLRRWQRDQDPSEAPAADATSGQGGVVVDFWSRRVLLEGAPLNLTELEFRIVAALLSRPGRAWSYADLRSAGWGDGPELRGDVETLRALIQRVRRKLAMHTPRVRIEAVRGYGYRGWAVAPGSAGIVLAAAAAASSGA